MKIFDIKEFKFGRGFVSKYVVYYPMMGSQELIDEQQRLIQMIERRNRYLDVVMGGETMSYQSAFTMIFNRSNP